MSTKRLWAIVVFFAGILEWLGIRSKGKDDTLSEYTWSKTKTPLMRGAVVGLVGWLAYHLSFGIRAPWSYWDLVFAGGGVILGVLSALRGKREGTGGL